MGKDQINCPLRLFLVYFVQFVCIGMMLINNYLFILLYIYIYLLYIYLFYMCIYIFYYYYFIYFILYIHFANH